MIRLYAEGTFDDNFRLLQSDLLQESPFNVGEWQSQKVGDNPMQHMRELLNVSLEVGLPSSPELLAAMTGAHLPWAEDHFLERVGGVPLNPSPSEEWWPFAQKVNRDHKSEEGGAFSHTYPERIWPKYANTPAPSARAHRGIRFEYGDLNDVVNQLFASPNTRQAFLPIWFPEDTGAVHGKRVPCTLGYHFQIRNNQLTITYYMRSCDLLRHFQDDVYMAGRLAQWVAARINAKRIIDLDVRELLEPVVPVELVMHIANLHVFEGDIAMMKYRDSKGLAWNV